MSFQCIINVALIENFINAKNLTYYDFCNQIGINLNEFKKILGGDTNIPLIDIIKIIVAMNAKVEDVISIYSTDNYFYNGPSFPYFYF